MTRLVFVDVDDTLLTPPYEAVRRVATLFGKKFPPPEAFDHRPHVDYHKAFPGLFRSAAEMWAIALLSLPFGHFRSQSTMPFDVQQMSACLADHRIYLLSKNPPSFTRWRLQRLQQLFNIKFGDRYIACGPIFQKGQSKVSIITQIAREREVALEDCLLIDDSLDNIKEVAAAGAQCALVLSSWNRSDAPSAQISYPSIVAIDPSAMAETIRTHLGAPEASDHVGHYIVPPLTPLTALRIIKTLIKRWWLYSEPIFARDRIIPIARNPWRSLWMSDPHAKIAARLQKIAKDPLALMRLRVLPLTKHCRPMRLPLALPERLENLDDGGRVRILRNVCRDLLASRGHHFVRDAMFYFTALDRGQEKQRILSSPRMAEAKTAYMSKHQADSKTADKLARAHVEEILTSRSYISCLFGEWVLDTILTKIFKAIHVKSHPAIRELEKDHFIFYAATHRSYLDSAVLWSILSHTGQSFPFAVGADKMRKVWFGRLGVRGGTFFIRRKFIDEIYVAAIGEHVASMQKPGSVIEVFLEGQRSRSGLTLPPKRGIASIVWDNMRPHDKVAIVPVSFAYNKIPESEKLIQEQFQERKKTGNLTSREISDMRVKLARPKSLYQKVRSAYRKLTSPKLSECFVHMAQPIIVDEKVHQKGVQASLNEAMSRINAASAALPSSMLCLFLLGAEDNHTTVDEAIDFLRFCESVMNLYQLPEHISKTASPSAPEQDVRVFSELPFVNRKFKRARLVEREVLCLDDLDIERASYYKNNILHFFVLPSILSHVLVHVQQGHTEELHRCLDHIFAKLQTTYFLPKLKSTHHFIESFLSFLSSRSLIEVTNKQWAVKPSKRMEPLMFVMSGLGAELIQGDLPHILEAVRRSSDRKDVYIASQFTVEQTTTCDLASVSKISGGGFYVHAQAEAQVGDSIEFAPVASGERLTGTIVRVEKDGMAVTRCPSSPSLDMPYAHVQEASSVTGSAMFRREQSGSGVIVNLSPQGALVSSTLSLKPGYRIICSLGAHDRAFKVVGRVMRVTEAGAGVRFENLTEEARARIVLLRSGEPDVQT